jgi:hypothetical protein
MNLPVYVGRAILEVCRRERERLAHVLGFKFGIVAEKILAIWIAKSCDQTSSSRLLSQIVTR